MNALVTVIIPVATHHKHLAPRAIASAQEQTIPCDIVPFYDYEGRGAGYARNQGARDTETDWIVFLDADDTLEPTFIEQTLKAYEKGKYVYTAWYMNDFIMRPKTCNPFARHDFKDGRGVIGGYHHPTTLLPTAIYNLVGGFDEQLPGHEDVDFFLKVIHAGCCGVYVDAPLFRYSPAGQRSKQLLARPDYYDIRKLVYERNGGENTIMSCCGDLPPMQANLGDRQEGDVQAVLMWPGIRTEGSVVPGRRPYRGGNQEVKWVAPADIEARPDLFRRVYDVGSLTPDKPDVLKEAGLF